MSLLIIRQGSVINSAAGLPWLYSRATLAPWAVVAVVHGRCHAGETAPVCCSLLAHNGEPGVQGCEPSTHPEPPAPWLAESVLLDVVTLRNPVSARLCLRQVLPIMGPPSGALEFSFPVSGQRLGKSGTGQTAQNPQRTVGGARPGPGGLAGVESTRMPFRGGPTGVLDHVPKARSRSSMVGVSYQAITSSMSHAGRRP